MPVLYETHARTIIYTYDFHKMFWFSRYIIKINPVQNDCIKELKINATFGKTLFNLSPAVRIGHDNDKTGSPIKISHKYLRI